MNILTGYKTYIAAAGLLGLGIFQISSGDVVTGIQSIFAALAAFGLRNALPTGK